MMTSQYFTCHAFCLFCSPQRQRQSDALYRFDNLIGKLGTQRRSISSSRWLPAHALPLSDFGSKRFVIYVFA